MLSPSRLRELIQPFGAELSEAQARQVLIYLELLLRWNAKINLTAIRTPEECATRHFGESFFACQVVSLGAGRLLDVGSGAGFPGLALKILRPELSATLLEPVGKKRAFLREAAAACGLAGVNVVASTIEEYARQKQDGAEDLVTVRAVGRLNQLLPKAVACLKPGGKLCLWLGIDQTKEAMDAAPSLVWKPPIPIPLSQRRHLLAGEKVPPPSAAQS